MQQRKTFHAFLLNRVWQTPFMDACTTLFSAGSMPTRKLPEKQRFGSPQKSLPGGRSMQFLQLRTHAVQRSALSPDSPAALLSELFESTQLVRLLRSWRLICI